MRHPVDPPPYSWSDRFPYGFGGTPQERLTNDLARVLRQHGIDHSLGRTPLVLAGFVTRQLGMLRTLNDLEEEDQDHE